MQWRRKRDTGAGSDVPGSAGNVPFRVNALEFHPDTGVLYGSWNNSPTYNLVTINTADGVTTTIGQTVTGLDAISFECGGEPPTPIVEVPTVSGAGLALLALLLAASAWMVMRRRGRV